MALMPYSWRMFASFGKFHRYFVTVGLLYRRATAGLDDLIKQVNGCLY